MTRRFVISLEVIAAAVMSAAMTSCFESEPNTYLRSLRNVDKMIIKPLDSVSLSDIDEFLASNIGQQGNVSPFILQYKHT